MFNPLEHPGIPLENQLRSWRELDIARIAPEVGDGPTCLRLAAADAIESEAIRYSHHLARVCPDDTVRRRLAAVRYVESQQHRVVTWLQPVPTDPLAAALVYERQAVDVTAWIARHEPDPYLRQAYEFGLLEDLDHLYR